MCFSKHWSGLFIDRKDLTMSITDINAPPIEPVTLAAAKEFLRVDGDHEDALIADLITTARERIEVLGRTSLIKRRRAYSSARCCTGTLYLNHSAVGRVHSVRIIDGADNPTEIPLAALYINNRASPVSITTQRRDLFSDYSADAAAIVVEFDAGYGDMPGDVPMQLRQAVLLLIAQHYQFRDTAPARPVPMLVDALLMPYRSVRL